MAPVLTRQRLEAERLREEDGRVVVPFRAAHVVIQVESGYWLDSVDGWRKVDLGDWVVRHHRHQYEVVSPAAFAERFEIQPNGVHPRWP